MKKHHEPKYVEMGTCTAGAIVGWLRDYAKLATRDNCLSECDIEQIMHIADWLFDRAEKIDRLNQEA